MAFPSSIDSFSNPQGTTNLATDDHANQHRVAGSAIVSLENKVGIGAGSASVNALLIGSGAGTSAWGTTMATVSVNNSTLGTPRITGGTASAFLLGTSTIQGGTADTFTLTGGISLGANGSITQTSTADHITLTAGASKVVKQSSVVQGGTAGTTVSYVVGFPQRGWQDLLMATGTAQAIGTINFPIAYSTIHHFFPQIVGVSLGTPTALSDYTTSVAAIGLAQAFGGFSITNGSAKVSLFTTSVAGANTHYAIMWDAFGV